MNDVMSIIASYSADQLEDLAQRVTALACEKRRAESAEITFDFEATLDPRKQGSPYVARLTLDADGNIVRQFYDLERIWARKEVTVSGSFRAREGDVIEQREGASWKNDHRYWYVVYDNALHQVASLYDSAARARVRRYLRGDISVEDLLKIHD